MGGLKDAMDDGGTKCALRRGRKRDRSPLRLYLYASASLEKEKKASSNGVCLAQRAMAGC